MFIRKGQSTLEYALIIAVVVAGLLLMQFYVKRGYSGRLKSASDDIGEQYDPSVYTANTTITEFSNTVQTVNARITNTAQGTGGQSRIRTGTENIGAWNNTANLYAR